MLVWVSPCLWPSCNRKDTAGSPAPSGYRNSSPHTCRTERPRSRAGTHSGRPPCTDPTGSPRGRSRRLEVTQRSKVNGELWGVALKKQTEKVLTFAAGRPEAEEVGLAALAVQTGDARLALALSCNDVTLTVGGANRITVTPADRRQSETNSSSRKHKHWYSAFYLCSSGGSDLLSLKYFTLL